MRNIIYIFLVLIIISCEQGKKNIENGEQAIEENIRLSKEFSWENSETENVYGEVLFIPVYSSIYHQSDQTIDLTATLSIHNIDINSKIKVIKVNYYNSDGKLVRNIIKDEFELNALQSRQFIIKETDISGGTAAKFIIQWKSNHRVIKPIIEAVMISTSSQQGISFKTESKVISSKGYE